jgi:hypothetical protein
MKKTDPISGPLLLLLQLSSPSPTLLTDAAMPVSIIRNRGLTHDHILTKCKDRGDYHACEGARDEKHDGRREEQRGERQIENGSIIGGLGNIVGGASLANQGQRGECRTGGRC